MKKSITSGDGPGRHQAGQLAARARGIHRRRAGRAVAREQGPGEGGGQVGRTVGEQHLVAVGLVAVLVAVAADHQQAFAQENGHDGQGARQEPQVVGQRDRGQGQRREPRGDRVAEHGDAFRREVEHRDEGRQQHQGHQRSGDFWRVPFHQPDDQEGAHPDRHRVEVGVRNGVDQGQDLHEVTLGVHRGRHGLLEVLRRRQQARRGVAHMGSGEDLPDLVGEHLDAEPGDEARHHGAREEVGEERQPEDPEDEKQQRADHGQRQGVLQAKRIPGRGEGDEGGPDQGGHRRRRGS